MVVEPANRFQTISEWIDSVSTLYNLFKIISWEIADELKLGIDLFGKRITEGNQTIDLVDTVAEQIGVSAKTIQNWISVSRKFPKESRPEDVPMYHCVKLLGAEPGVAEQILHEAKAYGWSAEQIGMRRAELEGRPVNPTSRMSTPPTNNPNQPNTRIQDLLSLRKETSSSGGMAMVDDYKDVPYSGSGHNYTQPDYGASVVIDYENPMMVNTRDDVTSDLGKMLGKVHTLITLCLNSNDPQIKGFASELYLDLKQMMG